MFETIEYRVENHVAWITLNRPDNLNAFTEQMNKEIIKAFRNVRKDEQVRSVVITGSGRAFSAGEDLAGVHEDTDHAEFLRNRYNPMIREMAALEKPIIAAVNGVAAGAGMSLALASDFRLASEKASFVEAFIHIGLVPDSGNLFYLPRLVGHAKAMELAVLGEKIKADEAKNIGLVTSVSPEEQFMDDVKQFAERLACMPTKAIGLIKRYLYKSWDHDLNDMLEYEAYAQRTAGQTKDHKEGINAFFAKRTPEYSGK
ncbi:2-(1,2-epoxy-1,2-dihydrophenyl)acetyl-CoA isomerase [Alteribacter lacisalsi]|uniref:2-(1,2-epoxy-1,2-dihydrophenyl)acetyl-CoA isomerase n=1 Tax=Alteribacter lacisalsi TaxID=2045244 RepID=A0A2W0H9Q6_9BACI|nr:enoyl-CoA hydratase-related protein [Alteribacter lacisalsi]PYZ97857.1 2-(1,2-epoxy-1,2-dihydrophenyl)acetyl-CoA isomerase [Alteribacter lacisalsi]